MHQKILRLILRNSVGGGNTGSKLEVKLLQRESSLRLFFKARHQESSTSPICNCGNRLAMPHVSQEALFLLQTNLVLLSYFLCLFAKRYFVPRQRNACNLVGLESSLASYRVLVLCIVVLSSGGRLATMAMISCSLF